MDPDLEKLLKSLKFKRITEVWQELVAWAESTSPSYTEFLKRVLQAEYDDQQDRFLKFRVQRARIPERWSLGTFPWDRQPGADRRVIDQLALLDFLTQGRNIVIMGDTGVGKTGLASGILIEALHKGYRCLFCKAQELFDEMYASLADRSTRSLLDRLTRMDLILIDELGYLNLKPEQTNIFFKLMEERYARKAATIITTNLDYDDWYGFLGQKQMVAALLDRLRHRCTTLRINGPSLRAPQA